MLMVAPSGRTNEETSLDTPSRRVHSMFRGSVPTDEALENANAMAGAISLKNLNGEMPPIVLTVSEYTTSPCTR